MRVVLHCPFVLQKNTGITRHIFGLLHGLVEAEGDNEFLVLWPPQAPFPDFLPRNFTSVPLTIGTGGGEGNPLSRILRESGFVKRLHREQPFDVFHSPFGYLPFSVPTPTVNTLHDLRVLRHPETFSRLRGLFLRWAIPHSLKRATVNLAISQATRTEALALVKGLKQNRIRAAYPGVEAHWRDPVTEATKAVIRIKLEAKRYLLAVGTDEAHKNLPRLIEAFALLKRGTQAFDDLKLVLVGGTFATGKGENVLNTANRLGILGDIIRPGILSDEDLKAAYAAASVLCFPSLYEGFGYPPLEAMAVGTPVVTSRATCLPEVVGNAAELVDPLKPEAIKEGLQRVLTDETRRAELIRAGHQRVTRYDWTTYANEVLTAYEDAQKNGEKSSPARRT